jgi:hypothetical protein
MVDCEWWIVDGGWWIVNGTGSLILELLLEPKTYFLVE